MKNQKSIWCKLRISHDSSYLRTDPGFHLLHKKQLDFESLLPKNLQFDGISKRTHPTWCKITNLECNLDHKFQDVGMYSMTAKPAADSITVQRSYLFNTVLILNKDYSDLRNFYSQMETKDKESVVLKVAPQSASAATPASN